MGELQNLVDVSDYGTIWKKLVESGEVLTYFKKLDENAVLPIYAHDGDVGMDLTATSAEYDAEKDCYIYHTSLSFETDKHYGILLFPRSSNRKTDAYLCNHVGIADSAIYRGEIMLCFKNRTSLEARANVARSNVFFENALNTSFTISGDEEVRFSWPKIARSAQNVYDDVKNNPMAFAPYKVGDRIAQMVVLPYPNVVLLESDKLSETERGEGGFGSTGN